MTAMATDVIKDIMWDSAKEAFEKMIFLPVETTEKTLEESSKTLCGTITFTGQVLGSFSILCRTEGAEKIARAMLMMEPDDPVTETDVCDAFGELTNLVIGGIKTRLNDATPDFRISIPTVTQGLQINPSLRKGMTQTDMTVDSSGEPLQMIMIHKTAAN